MLAQMQPYTPSLYEPNGYGRYRQYPRNVETPIPGAGYDVGEMVWAEQELNLDGSGHPQHHGNYARVPLRGMGEVTLPTGLLMNRSLITMSMAPPSGPSSSTPADDLLPEGSPPPSAPPDSQSSAGFMQRRLGPVPVWMLLAGAAAAAVGGGAWWYLKE